MVMESHFIINDTPFKLKKEFTHAHVWYNMHVRA